MTACRWNGTTRPRTVVGRHENGCDDETCRGCQECVEPHCRVCGVTHANGACAECLADVRANLREIGRLCDALPEEVEHRGVEGEAMMLLGPATDPEAWGHRQSSILSGRIVHPECDAREPEAVKAWLEKANDQRHPLTVLGTWRMVYEDALEHDSRDLLTIGNAIDYLDRNLTYVGGYEHVPFEDMARELRACVGHLEAVLHDGEQVDKGAPCLNCNALLERTWGRGELHDGWRCPRCKRVSTEEQYRLAVAHLHRENATHLTDREMEIRTGVKPGTIRAWANRDMVARRQVNGRVVYSVADVMRVASEKGLVA